MRSVFFIHKFSESLAAREASWSLRHCRTRRIESAQWQNIDLAEQISDWPRRQLLPQLIVAHFSGIATVLPILEPIRPVIIGRAVPPIADNGRKSDPVGIGARRVEICVARGFETT